MKEPPEPIVDISIVTFIFSLLGLLGYLIAQYPTIMLEIWGFIVLCCMLWTAAYYITEWWRNRHK